MDDTGLGSERARIVSTGQSGNFDQAQIRKLNEMQAEDTGLGG
jgi:alanyl-tRNA synthetase